MQLYVNGTRALDLRTAFELLPAMYANLYRAQFGHGYKLDACVQSNRQVGAPIDFLSGTFANFISLVRIFMKNWEHSGPHSISCTTPCTVPDTLYMFIWMKQKEHPYKAHKTDQVYRVYSNKVVHREPLHTIYSTNFYKQADVK